MSTLADKLNSFIYWLTPSHMRDNISEHTNVRMFLISHLFGPLLGHPITAFLFWNDPNPMPHVAVLGASITAFWLFPIALKIFQKSYFVLALISVQNLSFAILWAAHYYGGNCVRKSCVTKKRLLSLQTRKTMLSGPTARSLISLQI